MRSSKGRISNSPRKPGKSCSTTSRSCLRTGTVGKPKSPATWNWTHRTDDRPQEPFRGDHGAGAGDGEGHESGARVVLAQGNGKAVADHAEGAHGDDLRQGRQFQGAGCQDKAPADAGGADHAGGTERHADPHDSAPRAGSGRHQRRDSRDHRSNGGVRGHPLHEPGNGFRPRGSGRERGKGYRLMSMTVMSFYLFAISALAGGLFTVISRNPVHSVLWLILAFISSAGLFVLLGAEFVAMLLIIVYVGAVAVLFLFVVMMLDVDFAALKAEMARYMPLALLIGVILLMQFGLAFGNWQMSEGAEAARAAVTPDGVENTAALGMLLYDKYFLLFQTSGLILLVAMIGAIVLTLRHRSDIKRQDVLAQMYRDPAKAMELKDVKPGQGL